MNLIRNQYDRQRREMINNILLWIQKWSGQLNSWAWTKWDRRNRGTWIKGYNKWKKDERSKR